jgi:hypothetical protein
MAWPLNPIITGELLKILVMHDLYPFSFPDTRYDTPPFPILLDMKKVSA